MDTAVMVRAVDSNIAERKCMVTSLIMLPLFLSVTILKSCQLFYYENIIIYLYLMQV